MSYKVAVGSSDGKNVNLHFGEVEKFLIFTVDGDKCNFSGIRPITTAEHTGQQLHGNDCNSCEKSGTGCGGPGGLSVKISAIDDCRCVLCSRIGLAARKQFERKAISVFDIECPITEALEKISFYYDRVDNHISLRK